MQTLKKAFFQFKLGMQEFLYFSSYHMDDKRKSILYSKLYNGNDYGLCWPRLNFKGKSMKVMLRLLLINNHNHFLKLP